MGVPEIFKTAEQYPRNPKTLASVFLQIFGPGFTVHSAGIVSEPLPEIACVSDTIFAMAPVDVSAGEALRRLVEYACVLLLNGIVTRPIAFSLRGSLGFGEVVADMWHTWQFDLRRYGAAEVGRPNCARFGAHLGVELCSQESQESRRLFASETPKE